MEIGKKARQLVAIIGDGYSPQVQIRTSEEPFFFASRNPSRGGWAKIEIERSSEEEGNIVAWWPSEGFDIEGMGIASWADKDQSDDGWNFNLKLHCLAVVPRDEERAKNYLRKLGISSVPVVLLPDRKSYYDLWR